MFRHKPKGTFDMLFTFLILDKDLSFAIFAILGRNIVCVYGFNYTQDIHCIYLLNSINNRIQIGL